MSREIVRPNDRDCDGCVHWDRHGADGCYINEEEYCGHKSYDEFENEEDRENKE